MHSLLLLFLCILGFSQAHFCINEYWDYYGSTVFKNQVVIVGGCGGGVGSQMAFVSTNNGLSWRDVSPPTSTPRLWNMYAIQFIPDWNAYVSAGFVANVVYSQGTTLTAWKKSPEPVGPKSLKQGFALNDMVFVNGTLYVAGDAGTIFTSTDLGQNWTFVSSIREGLGMYQFLKGIAYGNGILVAVGGQIWNPNQGPIIWSNDAAATWNYGDHPVYYAYLQDIVFVPNKGFYTVGASNHQGDNFRDFGCVLFSPNGQNWTLSYEHPKNGTNFYSVAYGNNILVAGGKALTVSYDFGKTWTEITVAPKPLTSISWIRDVSFGNGRFVAVGNYNKVWFSTDGKQWVAAAPKG
jgi:photosystem II stability/assembly factor-like uncharacterized protein